MNKLNSKLAPNVGTNDFPDTVARYISGGNLSPLFICSEARDALATFPSDSIDFCMTSPPYWGQRDYGVDGIGLEQSAEEYIENLLSVLAEVVRTLKPSGSLWLNLGDTYSSKGLAGIPWRVALRLIDGHGLILRNDVIWHKLKGGLDQSRDKLRNLHEYVFHFVKSKNYFYDADALRSRPREAMSRTGKVTSATGVSGTRYRRQIELSTSLNLQEKSAATAALEAELDKVAQGQISDFRMVIRGTQRTTHSDGEKVSGRARELVEKGYYFLRYHPSGAKMGDVWEIIPEDRKRAHGHYAAYPEELCRRPIACSCPEGGIVLDPFCGTGTTMRVAQALGRRSIGIDLSPAYIAVCQERCGL